MFVAFYICTFLKRFVSTPLPGCVVHEEMQLGGGLIHSHLTCLEGRRPQGPGLGEGHLAGPRLTQNWCF